MSLSPESPSPPRSILIVDDERSVRVSLDYMLASAGYRTLCADSGLAAVAALDENEVHGALVDLHMPVMNGFDTCLRLKAKAAERGRNLAVWLMTGACSAQVRTRGAEIGVLAVFAKPFDYSMFFTTLETGLSGTTITMRPSADAQAPAA